VKDLINKQKRKKKQRVKPDYNEDDLNAQMELFEQSKIQNMQNYSQEAYIVEGNFCTSSGEVITNKKARFDQIEHLFNGKNKEEELDFDK
jgi:hypothetical protein